MKKIAFIFFLGIFFLFISAFKVAAQTPPAQASQIWKCLRGDSQGFTFNGAGNTNFTQNLYADGFPTDGIAYVVACVGTATGSVCSSGDPTVDKMVFNADNTTLFPYKVVFTGGSAQRITLGKLSTSATITTSGLTGGLVFYAVTIGEDQFKVGMGAGQKQGVFSFSDPVTTKCVTISWNTVFPPPPPSSNNNNEMDNNKPKPRYDPFGIVFDSQSLEPLPDKTVTVLDKDKKIYSLLGLTNPQTTKADGLFVFLVEPGIYYLKIAPATGYTFSANPNLQPNYIKIYHKMDGSNSIYKPDEPVPELIDTPEEVANGAPFMEHRDIPLDPGTNPPYNPAPVTISYSAEVDGNTLKIDGKVSLPFTFVSFSQGATLITKVQADRFGFYEAILDNRTLQQDQDVTATYEKVDLTKIDVIQANRKSINSFIGQILSYFSLPLFAQTHLQIGGPTRSTSVTPTSSGSTGFSLSPILAYIEGYAYDQNNNVLPSATVRLKLKMNNAIIYQTKADDKGYFKIDPKYIPLFQYYLEFLPVGGGTVTSTTSEFAKMNKEFLTKEKINLVNATKDNKPIASSSASNTASFSPVASNQRPSQLTITPVNQGVVSAKNSSILLFAFIIFFCLVVAGFVAFSIIKNKRSQPTLP